MLLQNCQKRIRMNLSKSIRIPDYFTLANVVCGISSIMLSVQGAYFGAGLLMLLGVVFDYADGKVARALKSQHSFGAHLDNLADVITFGVAPATYAFSQGATHPISIIILIYFVVAGVLRLARFADMKDKFMDTHFVGMPITVNGALFPIIFFLRNMFIPYFPTDILSILYLISAVLMVSTIKVSKLR